LIRSIPSGIDLFYSRFEWRGARVVWSFMMTSLQLAPAALINACLVRSCELEYNAAIRAEENAPTEVKAWRLAKVSGRAHCRLQAARAGLPLPETKLPRTARNLAKQGLAALATIGRVIARALAREASLRKAQAAAALARVARNAARLVRQALRAAVRAVARRALLIASIFVPATVNKEIPMVNVPKLAQRITAGQGHNHSEVAVDGKLLRYTIIVEPGTHRSLGVQLRGDRFVFSGGFHGEHSLAADELITNAARLLAHFNGYVDNNVQHVEDACAGYFTRAALVERCIGGAS
jgi:hypothetical protein